MSKKILGDVNESNNVRQHAPTTAPPPASSSMVMPYTSLPNTQGWYGFNGDPYSQLSSTSVDPSYYQHYQAYQQQYPYQQFTQYANSFPQTSYPPYPGYVTNTTTDFSVPPPSLQPKDNEQDMCLKSKNGNSKEKYGERLYSHRYSHESDKRYNSRRAERNDRYDSGRHSSKVSGRRDYRQTSRSPSRHTHQSSRVSRGSRSSIEQSESVPRHTRPSSTNVTPPPKKRRRKKRKTEKDDRYEKLRPKWYDGDKSESDSETDESDEPINIEDMLPSWSRSSPADPYYHREMSNPIIMVASEKTKQFCQRFENDLIERGRKARKENEGKAELIKQNNPEQSIANTNTIPCHHHHDNNSDSDSSDSGSSDDDWVLKGATVMERKQSHPDRLHAELWYNELGEMNDGPLCRCSAKARKSGIRHGYHAGEEPLEACNRWTNNADRLYHYVVTISPPTNFLIKTPTIINHDSHEFIFEGFSLFSHYELPDLPTCQVIRFNIEYSILYLKDKFPENFCIEELNLFHNYLYEEILELLDLNLRAVNDVTGCPRFHFMPRFVRGLSENGKEILSMNEVLLYLLKNNSLLVNPPDLTKLLSLSEFEWLNHIDNVKGMIVTYPGKKPSSIRVDQIDRDKIGDGEEHFPMIVHFGIRPPQLSYAGNPEYQKALRSYVKFRHLLANMAKPSYEDKRQLENKEAKLQEMRVASKMKKDVTIAVSSEGFWKTGLMCDVVQHALLMPVLVRHLRFHRSLDVLEERIQYKFQTRFLLQLALTHPSYRENFGTNPDHARNSLTNCGIRQPEYGDRRIHYINSHKRGINTLINIMSRFGHKKESGSKISNNERLEFLGDSVVEFLSSIHLFHLFPNLEEGGLATYRAAIVQNQQLSVLAEKLKLQEFVLHAHGSDLCHSFELKHAMANCFEALMGAIFIDSGIEEADIVFSRTLFHGEETLFDTWINYKPHPLQEQEPEGDRKWIETYPILQKLAEFEKLIGIEFRHIRILARAFTDRSIGFNYLTLGSNQRLEFLGDTVLQLVSSEYLFRFFPEHHEGHLSLLRSSLVNNRTQSVVCDDLGMTEYAMYSNFKTELKTKDRADLLEAFLGALYIDRGLDFCRVFCSVCFFPRLQQFIINQTWNDPKSKLQQCCLTLRTMEGGEPDIPVYKVIECKGPTNTRVYTVAVYFRNERLAKSSGHSIQKAEMNAAKNALEKHKELFPHLNYQRRIIERNAKSFPSHESRSRSRSRDSSSRKYSSRTRSPEPRHYKRSRSRS